jgi:hypothetical protein
MNAKGQITEITDNGFYAFIPFPDIKTLIKRQVSEVGVQIDDGRAISTDQRRKVFALIRDITDYISAPIHAKRKREEREVLRQMQLLYIIDRTDCESVRYQLTQNFCRLSGIDIFSLSDVNMTTAREFIDWLVELCVVHGIPCNDTLMNRAEDVGRYLYACVANRRCCICGHRADIHEVDRVGMGGNRRKMHHLNQRVQPLCREHHIEVGNIGQSAFDEKYHLTFIRLDEHLCKEIGWKA